MPDIRLDVCICNFKKKKSAAIHTYRYLQNSKFFAPIFKYLFSLIGNDGCCLFTNPPGNYGGRVPHDRREYCVLSLSRCPHGNITRFTTPDGRPHQWLPRLPIHTKKRLPRLSNYNERSCPHRKGLEQLRKLCLHYFLPLKSTYHQKQPPLHLSTLRNRSPQLASLPQLNGNGRKRIQRLRRSLYLHTISM